MFTVELYARIRRSVMIDGLSRREAAKRFGNHCNTSDCQESCAGGRFHYWPM